MQINCIIITRRYGTHDFFVLVLVFDKKNFLF